MVGDTCYVLVVQGGTGRAWKEDVGGYAEDVLGSTVVREVNSGLRNRGGRN